VRKLTAIAMVLVATACTHTIVDVTRPTTHVVFSTDGGSAAELSVGVAETPEQRQQGLSGIKRLHTGYGMAFSYEQPTTDEFWMKDTLIPLSVAFVRTDGTIVAIRKMIPCTADPCPTYASPEPYTLAIEASPGWFRSNHIAPGDSAALEEASSV
jgi:uncharacterized membrane protein (UPF0127 family)